MKYPFHVPVVGVSYRQEAVKTARPGQRCVLHRQPDNPHDPNAVAVYSEGGDHLGYLPAKVAERIPPEDVLVASISEVLTGETWGLRLKVSTDTSDLRGVGETSEDPSLTSTPSQDGGEPAEVAAARKVYANSGRLIGAYVGEEDGRVVASKPDGTEVRLPRAVVRVGGDDS